jgi:hypothetical protein
MLGGLIAAPQHRRPPVHPGIAAKSVSKLAVVVRIVPAAQQGKEELQNTAALQLSKLIFSLAHRVPDRRHMQALSPPALQAPAVRLLRLPAPLQVALAAGNPLLLVMRCKQAKDKPFRRSGEELLQAPANDD